MLIVRTCPITGKVDEQEIILNKNDLVAWQSGNLSIQQAMPYLSPDQREFILTGITPQIWEECFPEEEESDES